MSRVDETTIVLASCSSEGVRESALAMTGTRFTLSCRLFIASRSKVLSLRGWRLMFECLYFIFVLYVCYVCLYVCLLCMFVCLFVCMFVLDVCIVCLLCMFVMYACYVCLYACL